MSFIRKVLLPFMLLLQISYKGERSMAMQKGGKMRKIKSYSKVLEHDVKKRKKRKDSHALSPKI